MKKNIINKAIIVSILFALALFICMQSSFAPSGSYLANSDAAIYKQVGFSIANGKIPYTEIYENKGPIFFYLNALGEMIDGTYGIFVVELVLMFVATIFCYKTARLFTNKSISLLSTIVVFSGINEIFWHGNMTEEYVLPFTFIAMYYFIKYLLTKEIHCREIITIGICFAISIMIRANLIAIYVGCILVIFIDLIISKRTKDLFKAMLYFITGAIIAIGPMAIYLYANNALIECIKQVYLGPSGYFSDITILQKTRILQDLLLN